MITLEQYFMGRDVVFKHALTPDIEDNAQRTVARVNVLLERAAIDGVYPGVDEKTGCDVASGWRPSGINDRTQNAAAGSSHITAEAVDLQDTLPSRELARWCLRNLDKLEAIGLWMEDPRWTPDWVHLQTKPPKSGLRVYRPSMNPALAVALPEQQVHA